MAARSDAWNGTRIRRTILSKQFLSFLQITDGRDTRRRRRAEVAAHVVTDCRGPGTPNRPPLSTRLILRKTRVPRTFLSRARSVSAFNVIDIDLMSLFVIIIHTVWKDYYNIMRMIISRLAPFQISFYVGVRPFIKLINSLRVR